jgi:Flp pilus assembly protein protease CpaA
LAMPVHGAFAQHGIPSAADHLAWAPRVLAIAFNSVGTLAVVAVALRSLRRRPVGNALIVLGVAAAAIGSALAGRLGAGGAAIGIAAGVALLYAGFTLPTARRPSP